MAKKPKNALREGDHWGVGEKADGSINAMTEDEAREALARRNADDATFGIEMMEEDLDDISDLDEA